MSSLKEQIQLNIEKTNRIKSTEFKSTHDLQFETAPFYHPSATRFKVGTFKLII